MVRGKDEVSSTTLNIIFAGLIHDSIQIRKLAHDVFEKVLFAWKPKKEYFSVQFNSLEEFQKEFDLTQDYFQNESLYKSKQLLDKSPIGFYQEMSYQISKYSAPKTHPDRQLLDQIVVSKFQEDSFLKKYFYLNSLSSLSDQVFPGYLFKYFYICYGLQFNGQLLFDQLEKQLEQRKPDHDNFALNIFLGVAKASKTFSYGEMIALKQFTVNVLLNKFAFKFNKESQTIWESFFVKLFDNKDFRRWKWLLDVFMNPFNFQNLTPYYQSRYLTIIWKINASLLWKYPLIRTDLLNGVMKANLRNDFHIVRKNAGQ